MGLRTRVAAVWAVAAIIATVAQAQIAGGPAGPRPGPIVVLDVEIDDESYLQILHDDGYNVTNAWPGHAEVYATPEERDRLLSEGYTITEIEVQPGEPEPETAARGLGVYHKHAALTAELQAYAAAFPTICRLVNVGTSVQGRELWAMLITDNPDVEEDEPEFKYVSSMHGDEIVGVEMCLYLIKTLLVGYGSSSRITDLVDSTEIWIMPLMNPDGREIPQRYNWNGYDLNRSFPRFPEDYTGTRFDSAADFAGLEPEVVALMQWALDNSFVLSANFHGGVVVVSYPYDAEQGIPSGQYAASPDDALYIDMSLLYAEANPCMTIIPGTPCALDFTGFPDGITNGNDWYVVKGGMQGWMYRFTGNAEVTIELSVDKTPLQSTIPQYWADNGESMLVYLEAVHRGIRGIVTDRVTGVPIYAKATVTGNAQPVFSDPDVGDYYRLLLPGTYTLTFNAAGYEERTVPGISVTGGPATRVDVELTSLATAASESLRDSFETLDTDSDDALTLAESGLIGSTFDAIDADNDDHITMEELLEATFGAGNVGVMNPVYVSAANGGAESGTIAQPFNTLREGAAFVAPGGAVNITQGDYNESLGLNKNLAVQLVGPGAATVGPLP